MDILSVAVNDAVASKIVVAMLLMAAVTSLVVLIEPRGARWFALAVMTLLAAHLFFGHRLAGAPLVPYGEIGDSRTRSDAKATHVAAGCTDHAVSADHGVARRGAGSPRQVETAR